MKVSPLLAGIAGLTLLALTATTLYAQTATGTSLVDKMKAAARTSFTLSADLNPGQTGFESAPIAGKKTGNMLTAGEWNRVLELLGQGGSGGCTPSASDIYDSGWVLVPRNSEVVVNHNLGTLDTIVFFEQKVGEAGGSGYNPTPNTITGIPDASYGFWQNKSANQIGLYMGYNAYDSGIRYLKVVMVKISALASGCGGSGSSPSSPTNLVYINPDNTSFAPLTCTPGVNYTINPIAFSAESAGSFTTKKVAVLGTGNWQVKGTGFVRIRNKNPDVGQALRVSSVLDGTTTHLLDNSVDAGMYANSFLDPVSVPAGKTTELRVSVKNNTLHGGNIVVWCN